MVASGVASGRVRLDVLLVDRGLAPSRERAQSLVMAGVVTVDGAPADKPGRAVRADADVTVVAKDHPWASRGGVKLAAALDAFAVSAEGRRCLDVGASTGGFTDVLLQRGAAQVVALDVGRGQLDWRLRQDPRVVVMDGVNARHLAPGDLAGPFGLVSIDVSFISLSLVLPALLPFVAADTDLIALVKPQFEVGKGRVGRGGVVRDAALREEAIVAVLVGARTLGLACIGRLTSPLPGPAGNVEELVYLRRSGAQPPVSRPTENVP
jgi:23S rRNA (cytidine1920-2'-O)/16S rRNA (cytidine1409-2'-O)-methyltransferase